MTERWQIVKLDDTDFQRTVLPRDDFLAFHTVIRAQNANKHLSAPYERTDPKISYEKSHYTPPTDKHDCPGANDLTQSHQYLTYQI